MAYDTYQAHEWQHGEVITSQRLNTLEQAVENGSTVTKYLNELQYNERLQEDVEEGQEYDAVHGTENNKIETAKSVDRKIASAIGDLNQVALTYDDGQNTHIHATLDESTDNNNTIEKYTKIITSITQSGGKIIGLTYRTIPFATKFTNEVDNGTPGLVKIGQDLNIDNGTLSGGYAIDSLSGFQGTLPTVEYNNNSNAVGYNPLTTVKSVDYRIRRIVEAAPSLGVVQNNPTPASLTITGITPNANGEFSLDRSRILIDHSQFSDVSFYAPDTNNDPNAANHYTLVTKGYTDTAIETAIETAINNLDVDNATSGEGTHITGFGAGKTLSALTESNGKIGATFQDISIIKSQVSDLETLRSLTSEEIEDPRESEGLLSTSDYDTFIELVQPMDSAPVSGTDTRPAGGLITPTDKDNLDALFAKNDLLTTMTSAPVSGTDEREDAGLISKTDKDALDTLYAKNDYLVAMDSKPIGTDTRLTSGLFKKDDKDALDTLLKNITIDSSGNIVGIKIYNAEGTAYKTLTYSGLVEPEPEPQPGE